ncbi:EVE domain-containing protein [Thalassospira permensis]|uniref:Ubiquinol-cytochrome C reductase n=1 Tax=Thalassospira permensis NBRC 106175 TaxID=1353532 RepID=A0ABR4TRE8_9PROT|nr:EVE domain-containing protein [Thalassospira permensis]KEO58309.1 ubiquinol-cytochrome C reductase [Thalassospira permensis NBRC 106175]
MAYWLIKTEPGSWSWDDQVRKGVEGWDGVRNHQAAKNLKTMQIGDLAFFYHSVNEKRIVGIVEVVREAYPDPTDATGKFVQVDFKTVKPVPRPVTLADIKADPRFAELPLLRQSRLSVMPIDDASWTVICEMGGVSA